MTVRLTQSGYEQTLEKLSRIEERLADLERRSEPGELHRNEARRSYERMIAQYRAEIKLYEAQLSQSEAG